MFRKHFSIIMIFTILFNSGGYYLWFCFQQQQIQKEVKHKLRKSLKDDELTLIIGTPSNEIEIQWIKKDKEFRFKGEMYDVVRTKVVDKVTHYYCLNDIREKKLIAKYNKHHESKNDVGKRLKRTFTNLYSPPTSVQLNDISISKNKYYYSKIAILSNTKDVSSPPPKGSCIIVS